MRRLLAPVLAARRRLLEIIHEARLRAAAPKTVVYYPVFPSERELTNHVHRARWYLPHVPGKVDVVRFFEDFADPADAVGPTPECMCDDAGDDEHIEVIRGTTRDAFRSLWKAQVILAWKTPRTSPALWLMRLLGCTVLNVGTDDASAMEYGTYCGVVWRYLTNRKEREAILSQNAARFRQYAGEVKAGKYQQACVMGNGPSLDKLFRFDFSDSLSIICNSTIADDRIVEHVKPAFVAAADVVSHLGVSAPSGAFRRQLFRAMDRHDFLFVTTTFGYLTTLHFPAYRDRIVMLEQAGTEPVYDLLADFSAPALDSIMNIVMLPLAATFSDTIWLLGTDGKSATGDNEDFWAHANTAGTSAELVKAGHACHPVFDVHRQQMTYERYNASVELTVAIGEERHGKIYRCLYPSSTPALAARTIPESLRAGCTESSRCSLSDLSRRLQRLDPPESLEGPLRNAVE